MRSKIEYKTPRQISYMREAGLIVAAIHDALREAAQPGAVLRDLDACAAEVIAAHDARSNFLGYYGYPASVCISVNDTVVHGIPDDTTLREGDLVSFDCGAYIERDGQQWHGDACLSVLVGGKRAASRDAIALDAVTNEAMWAGVASLASGKTVACVGDAVETVVEEQAASIGFEAGIVEEFIGHGIGTAMHQEPDILNFRARGRQPKIKPGMVVCVEPILTRGSNEVVTLEDQWTVKTCDHQLACHWEHEVAILDDGISVLTAPDCGVAELARFGVTPVAL
ncbi:type I methionyl aminopeptidase [Nanchangia anserum]|uniref:Methionine aminopeptidase n=1 Tax=Nanchangia anserum TaxID=2692125 RepID=A0A8I0KU06_9ACTO|nr:type I methionyl aminopeptidase [Nanchangia anserum]MBD3689183.1 type I methionyl aminopeptidase [Nanchangia anserum]